MGTEPLPRRLVRAGAVAAVVVILTAGLLEVGLRLAPEVIPLGVLADFEAGLRTRVADARGLPSASQVQVLERDDGGPVLKLYRPLAVVPEALVDRERPGPVHVDRLGFCNPPDVLDRHRTFDVVALGDSFTWCTGVEPAAAWPAQLAAATGLRTYSFGRPGIGPYEHLQILARLGLRLRPRVVVMAVYEGNDLRDALRHAGYVAAAARGEATYIEAQTRDAVADYGPLLDTAPGRVSYAYNVAAILGARGVAWARHAIARRAERAGDAPVDFRYELTLAGAVVPFNTAGGDKDEVRTARALRSGAASLEVFTSALQRFAEVARREGFVPVVMYAPSAHSAYAASARFADPGTGDLLRWYSTTQREYFASRAGTIGYHFVDATPALQAEAADSAPGRLLYFPGNLHLTREGHRVAAAALARALPDHLAPASGSPAPGRSAVR
jgi:hypothetical protein